MRPNADIKDRLTSALRIRNMTPKELSNKTNIPKSSISQYMSGYAKPKDERLYLMSQALNVDPTWLLGYDVEMENKEPKEEPIECNNIYKLDKIKLPMLGKVACGEPIFADEDRESYIMVGTDIGADFCLQCQGDSMINARIHDGDIVFVKKTDIVENGEIAVVIIDDEATLKRFFYYREQNLVILKPENPKYQDIILTGEQLNQVRVIGRAVAFQSDVI